jgi:hypothetical protein
MFIIQITDNTGYTFYIGNGGTYIHQGEKYAVVVENPKEAKKYQGFNRACNAYKKLNQSCCNVNGHCRVLPVEEG